LDPEAEREAASAAAPGIASSKLDDLARQTPGASRGAMEIGLARCAASAFNGPRKGRRRRAVCMDDWAREQSSAWLSGGWGGDDSDRPR
jgi:hypothetical protein